MTSDGRRRMTLVVAALDEERWIRDTVEGLLENADAILDAYDLILVDDGSRDRTGAIMEEIARERPKVRVVHNPEPRGLGWMFWEFVMETEHPYFMMLAGNGESSRESVRRLMEATGSADLIVGYRTGQRRSFARTALSVGFQLTMSAAFGFGRIRDWTGMFVWPVAAVRKIGRLPPTNLYSVEVCTKLVAQDITIAHVDAPQGPARGRSKVVGLKTLRQTASVLWRMKVRGQ